MTKKIDKEQIRRESIEKELKLASGYDEMAEAYLKKGKHKHAAQAKRCAERCRRYADFLSKPDKS